MLNWLGLSSDKLYLLKYYHVRRIKPKYYVIFGVGAVMMVALFYFVEMRRGGLETGINFSKCPYRFFFQ